MNFTPRQQELIDLLGKRLIREQTPEQLQAAIGATDDEMRWLASVVTVVSSAMMVLVSDGLQQLAKTATTAAEAIQAMMRHAPTPFPLVIRDRYPTIAEAQRVGDADGFFIATRKGDAPDLFDVHASARPVLSGRYYEFPLDGSPAPGWTFRALTADGGPMEVE